MLKYLNLLCLIICARSSQSNAQSGPILLTDMLQIQQPANLSISANGQTAVFTVTSSVPNPQARWEYNYQTQIWMVSTNSNLAPVQLTTAKEGASQPAISPNGQQIVFVRTVDQLPQLFLLNLSTGGEAVQLTNLPTGASNPHWNKQGTHILFSSNHSLAQLLADSILNTGNQPPEWPLEKPGFTQNDQLLVPPTPQDPNGTIKEQRAWLAQNEKDGKAKVINKLNFQQEATTSSQLNFTHWYIIAAKANSQPRHLTQGFYSYSNAQLHGASGQLVAEGILNRQQHPDRAGIEQAIYLIDTTTKQPRLFLGAPDSSFGNAVVSPSGKWIAYTAGKSSFVGRRTLFIKSLSTPAHIPAHKVDIDRVVGNFQWNENEDALYFTAATGGGIVLYKYRLATKQLQALTPAHEGVNSYAMAANKLLMITTAVSNPFELYVTDSLGRQPQRISQFNHIWLQGKQISQPEKRSFTNDQDMVVDYWIMKPINWQANKKYPVVLQIHGGPTGMWGPGESSMWHEFQYWCAQGYTVVYSNPRGSGGYGEAFTQANINNWGTGPAADVLTALQKAYTEFTWIDTTKMTVTGGSYGGYLVAWILGHDNRFKAACAQRGVYDLRTFFGEGNAWRLVPNYFGGYPWQQTTYQVLERESPINYVQQMNTPLIIFHGENDLRTGVIQSEQLYKSLKVLNHSVEYVRHPGATHEITRSGNNRQRMDQMLRTLEFFNRFINH